MTVFLARDDDPIVEIAEQLERRALREFAIRCADRAILETPK